MPYKLYNHARLTRVGYLLRQHLRPRPCQHLRRADVVSLWRRKKGKKKGLQQEFSWRVAWHEWLFVFLFDKCFYHRIEFIHCQQLNLNAIVNWWQGISLPAAGDHEGSGERSDGSFITVGKRKWAVAWPSSDSACQSCRAAGAAKSMRCVSRTMICGASMMKL